MSSNLPKEGIGRFCGRDAMQQLSGRQKVFRYSAFLILGASVLSLTPARAQSPAPPAQLTPPSGNLRFLTAHAIGTQDYICLPSPNGNTTAWTFFGPQATLSIPFLFSSRQQVATHFLSPVPNVPVQSTPACTISIELNQLDCPTWQSSLDSSAVWGQRLESVQAGTDASCPNAGSIPCLLLSAVQTRGAQFGAGELGRTTYIQRLNTEGGAAPAGACKIGDVALVPYSADYSFFKAF